MVYVKSWALLLLQVTVLLCAPSLVWGSFSCVSCRALRPESDECRDCAALGELYASAGGTLWTSQRGWASAAAGFPRDFCSDFVGVACDAGGRVARLFLSGHKLSGSLPPLLSALTHLEELYGARPATLALIVAHAAGAGAGMCRTTGCADPCPVSPR